jgi:hypothetical protein
MALGYTSPSMMLIGLIFTAFIGIFAAAALFVIGWEYDNRRKVTVLAVYTLVNISMITTLAVVAWRLSQHFFSN